MSAVGELVSMNIDNFAQVVQFVEDNGVTLTVIGPEAPLVAGLSDALRAKGHLVMGAGRDAARLEGSKIFAKQFMSKHGIPTADFRIFSNAPEAKEFIWSPEGRGFRVLKADGLAAGKGVIIAQTPDEMLAAITEVLEEKRFGTAGNQILIEELLQGPEISLMAMSDGKTILPFPASQDHKRIYDADKGPNTGGMGAYAPTPFYDAPTNLNVEKKIVQPFLRGLSTDRLEFRGIIYFGLMLTKQGPKVLEFNVRLGDPETQAVLPLVDSDIYEAFRAVAAGELSNIRLQINPGSACTVVMASKGYPGSHKTGYVINGLNEVAKQRAVSVFHAGTKIEGNDIVTSGGRVLGVTGLGKTLDAAVVRAYQGVKRISFENMHYRKDIAGKALKNKTLTRRIKNLKTRRVLQKV